VFREGVPELLRDPAGGRMRRDVRMKDVSSVMSQDDQREQQSKRDRRHDEEVGGHHLARAVREKRSVRLGRRPRMPLYYFATRRLAHPYAQLL
jgi:hypothetical protein